MLYCTPAVCIFPGNPTLDLCCVVEDYRQEVAEGGLTKGSRRGRLITDNSLCGKVVQCGHILCGGPRIVPNSRN
jgi:hypothetical protein